MLGYDYLKYNNEPLPWAKSDTTSYKDAETVDKSESGYDRAIVSRLQQPSYAYTFRVSSFWLEKLLSYGREAQGVLTINGDAGHTVRPRVKSKKLIEDSQLTAGTDGLYEVTMQFLEL